MANKILTRYSFILFLIFLVLKLSNIIDWSWWWVTAPLWWGISLFAGVIVALIIFWILVCLFDLLLEIIKSLLNIIKNK